MKKVDLEPTGVKGLDVFSSQCDVRRDLHSFVDYIRSREVKRSHRGNNLSKTDARRLAKLMTHPNAVEQVKEDYWHTWVDYVDKLALKLGFVKYDSKGVYVGYSSQEPSFPNNYIQFQADKYKKFLALSVSDREHFMQMIFHAFGQCRWTVPAFEHADHPAIGVFRGDAQGNPSKCRKIFALHDQRRTQSSDD